jgi:hypothetical protein
VNIGLQALSVPEVSTHVQNLEIFMKLIAGLALALSVNGAFAITAHEKQIKEEMETRLELITQKVSSAEEHAKKEEAKEACDDIRELLKLYPDHLKAIGVHLNSYRTKVIVARDEVLQQLVFVHRQSVVCDQGENGEYVDAKDLGKKLGKISKSLKKQKKLIEKEKADSENDFYYNYEF